MAEQKKSGVPTPIKLVIGLVLIAVGGYLSAQPNPLEKMAEQGVPLNLAITIATIGVFFVLFPVIDSFFVTPLHDAINARTSELESTFSEAESLRSEMTELRTSYEKRIAETEASAREQIQNQIKEAQALGNQLKAQAAAEKEEMVKKAQAEIDQEKNRVLTDLRLHVVNLTLGATERVLGENVDNDRNRKLIEEFIDKVEVPG